jgi:glycosyltransferase involved in cell wall biosynthesis
MRGNQAAKLTIAIPTYNRNPMVLGLVRELLKQMTVETEVLILDNGSEVPVQQTLEHGIENLHEYPIHVERLDANVGQGLLRCMEMCRSPWMWGLTDKAVPRPDAIQTVLKTIGEHPDCIFLNFTPYLQQVEGGGKRRICDVETRGRKEMLENIIDYGATIDYMANVYHVPSYKKRYGSGCATSLNCGYLHSTSGAPQFAIVLHALGTEGKCYFSKEVIAERPYTPPEMSWSHLNFMSSYMTPLIILEDAEERNMLRKHILGFIPTRKYFLVKFLLMATRDRSRAEFYYRLYRGFIVTYDKGFSTNMVILASDILMKMPILSVKLLDKTARLFFKRSIRDAEERY